MLTAPHGRKNGAKSWLRKLELYAFNHIGKLAAEDIGTPEDWAGECTHYLREVCEMALAHDERDQTEDVFSRSDYLDKRRQFMNVWVKFLIKFPA
jgi:hypothetical protein